MCSLRYFAALLYAFIDAVARRIIASSKPHLHLAVPAAMHVKTRGDKVYLCRLSFAAHDVARYHHSLQLLPCLLLLILVQFCPSTNRDP